MPAPIRLVADVTVPWLLRNLSPQAVVTGDSPLGGFSLYAVPLVDQPQHVLGPRLVGPLGVAGATDAVVPAGIIASSSMTASVVAVRAVTPATINATSTVTGAVVALRAAKPATINATSAITAAVVRLGAVRPAAINATSSITAAVVRIVAVKPAAINATSAMAAAVVRLAAVRLATVNATSSISATVSGVGAALPGIVFYAVPLVDAPQIMLPTRMVGPLTEAGGIMSVAPATISATSSVTASVARRFPLHPATVTATSSISFTLSSSRVLIVAATGSGVLIPAPGVGGTMATSTAASSTLSAASPGANVLIPAPPTPGSLTKA